MIWGDRLKKIRRFLRDPNGDIWEDRFLLRLYNDQQLMLQNLEGVLEDVQDVRVPPMFETSYMYNWEWEFANADGGYVYQCFNIYDQADMVFTYWWEPSFIAGSTSGVQDSGYHFTHPWEAFMGVLPGDTPPVWLPRKFQKLLAIYWDKDPLDPMTKKEIQRDDMTWRTRAGETRQYRRIDELDNFIALYPIPTTIVWDDIDGDGILIGREDDTVDGEGIIFDADYTYASSSTEGAAFDIIETDDKLLAAFRIAPQDIECFDDEGDIPQFLTKYVEQMVLFRAFQANTDGKIESLEQYWEMRTKFSSEVINVFNTKRQVDRDYCLKTKGAPVATSRRRPRLPDNYPAMW